MKPQKLLEYLMLNTHRYIPINELSRELKATSDAILMGIQRLRQRGYIIENYKGKGFRLIMSDDLSQAGIYLRDLMRKYNLSIVYLKKTTSTQDVAKSIMKEPRMNNVLIIAEEQTHGRGRLGRRWVSLAGGIWVTLALRPKLEVDKVPLLSLMSGVSIVEAIERLTKLKPKLKWPNDILLRGKKVCGVLVEASVEGEEISAYIGIGVNVNNTIPLELSSNAISLKEILGHDFPRLLLLNGILRRIYENLEILRTNSEHILSKWRSYSYTLNKEVIVKLRDHVLRGRAVDIADDGALIVLTQRGLVKINVGDVIHLNHLV